MKNTKICHRHGPWPRLLLAGCWAALASLALPTRAAVTEAWVQRYSNVVSNAYDVASKVVSDGAGDIIVTGYTSDGPSDMLTIKYSGGDGAVIWEKRYNGPANSADSAAAVAVDSSGNVVVAGNSIGSGSKGDYYTAKYAAADGTLLWEKRYNGPANSGDGAVAVAVDGNGNVVVTGNSSNGSNYDYYTAKYGATDGALLWEKRYNGAENGDDYAAAVAVDSSDNVVVAGVTDYSDSGSNPDSYTAKYAAADGALLWEKRYNGPANNRDEARSVAVDGSGNVVVTGYSYRNGNNPDLYTAKYAAADGALLWEKHYNGPANAGDYANAVAVDISGNVVVTGTSDNGAGSFHAYTAKYEGADGALVWEQRYISAEGRAVAVDSRGNVAVMGSSFVARYAGADGALLWENPYGGTAASDTSGAGSVIMDGNGDVVITGRSYNGNNEDYYTAKYAAAHGTLLWEKRYNGPLNRDDHAVAVAVDGSGNVFVTGSSFNITSPSYHNRDNPDYYTAKYAAADGALLWEKRYNGLANRYDEPRAIALDGSGNVVVTGDSGNGSNRDYYTAKYAAADGALLWEKCYNGPANLDDQAQALAVDASGNVVVTGQSQNGPPANDTDYYTAKYAAADGALLWQQRYNGPANNFDKPQAVAMDRSGNVVVTGYSYNGTDDDYFTVKYAAADGLLLWEKRYNGPASDYDQARAVAMDGSGNVVVTGYSYSASNPDYYTAKYAAADGALLWEKRYDGPANRDDYDVAKAVAVDASGNVVVMGTASSGGNNDYYTAKYAAADGALLWEKRSNGPKNPYDQTQAVAVDGNGNVVVTGTSENDYYTAKYAAADGALLWEKRYNGPANGEDFASSLALGPNGMVAVTGSSSGDYATVVYRENLSPVSIVLVPGGVRLRFTGVPGRSYTIERAPAVTGPWSTIATPAAPMDSIIEHVDISPPSGAAFYRTSTP